MKIYISDGAIETLAPAGWKLEEEMQGYVQNNPKCICDELIQDDEEVVVIAREFSISTGEIDFLIMGESGRLYIVETKLAKNPTKSHVHNQLYDYAQALWHEYRHFETFEKFLQKCTESLKKYEGKSFDEHVKQKLELDDNELYKLKEVLKKNISGNSNINLIIAMDEMTDNAIKDLILYHNDISNAGVLMFGVELFRYATNHNMQIVVPKFYGIEAMESSSASVTAYKKWNETEFLEYIASNQKLDENTRQTIHKIMKACDEMGAEFYGSKGTSPDGHYRFPKINKTRSIFKINGDDAHLRIFIKTFKNQSDMLAQFIKLCSEIGLREVKSGYDAGGKEILVPSESWLIRVEDFITVLKKTCA